MLTSPVPRRRGARVRATLLTIGCALGSFALLAVSFCYIGATYEGPLRILEPYRAPTGDEAAGLIPMEYALNESDANDVVFVGDSTCRTGLDPRLFEQLSGLRAYNLGSYGSLSISGHLATLNAYLAHHPVPRVVVLCLSPTEVLRVQASSGGGDGGGTTAGTLYERFLRAYGPPSQRRGIFADGTASIRYFINRGMAIGKQSRIDFLKGGAPDRLNEPLYGFESETYRTLSEKTRERRGFFPLPREHGDAVVTFQPLEEPHSVNPWIDDGVRGFAELARAQRLRLMIRLAPISQDQSPWDSEGIPAWLKGLESRFPRVCAGRPEILWYERDVCWDAIHLNARGVERFTAKTAADVSTLLGSRTVATPSPRAPHPALIGQQAARQ